MTGKEIEAIHRLHEYYKHVVDGDFPKQGMPKEYYRHCTSFSFPQEAMDGFRYVYGYGILTQETLDVLSEFITTNKKDKKCIEIAGGSGYLTYALRERGVEIELNDICTVDDSEKHCLRVKQFAPIDNVCPAEDIDYSQYGIVVASWLPYQADWDRLVFEKLPQGTILITLGEGYNGCTGGDDGHVFLKNNFLRLPRTTEALNDTHISFRGMCDLWSVWKKN